MPSLPTTRNDAHMAKCCAASLALHLGLLALLLTVTASTVKHAAPIIIDFTLSSPPLPEQTRIDSTPPVAAPKQVPARQKPPTAAVQKATALQQEQAKPEPRPNPAVSNNAAPTPSAPQTSTVVTGSVPGQISTKREAGVAAAAPRSARTGNGGMTPGKAHQHYINEHFTYIRDLITQRLAYPRIARRMGWSGRVLLAFVVAEDGSVRSIHVRESSGYPVLDNSAMETVKSVAPFPRPPMAAEIVMPVQFRLR